MLAVGDGEVVHLAIPATSPRVALKPIERSKDMEENKSSNYFGSFLDAVVESADRGGEAQTSPMKLLEVLEENGPQRFLRSRPRCN